MIFNSLPFLIFLGIFLPIYFLAQGKLRILIALVGSYIFYGWWDWRFLSLIIFSTVLDYFLGKEIYITQNHLKRKILLTLSITANLGLLGFFKYYNFFIDSFATLIESIGFTPHLSTLQLILPVGISFYTFQTMSYTIDVYRREIEPERNFIKFATYVSFFPQLVAGPIVRAKDFLPQFDRKYPTLTWDRFINGFNQIVLGFFKKIAVADSLAVVVDKVYDSPMEFSSSMLILAVIFYSFQIYCDFSGYSDIAIGTAKILGFDFPENFRAPYFSENFSEFWRRWHISLSTWLRDYLYISLGGNRKGGLLTYRNLMITMLLGGLWHGANWTFIIWGTLHGFYLIIQRLIGQIAKSFKKNEKSLIKVNFKIINVLLVFIITSLTWVYFRSSNIETANGILSKIFAFSGNIELKYLFHVVKGAILIAILLIIDLTYQNTRFQIQLEKKPVLAGIVILSTIWLTSFFGTFDNQQFIYFQF